MKGSFSDPCQPPERCTRPIFNTLYLQDWSPSSTENHIPGGKGIPNEGLCKKSILRGTSALPEQAGNSILAGPLKLSLRYPPSARSR